MYDQTCCVCFNTDATEKYKLQDQVTAHSTFKVVEYLQYIVGQPLKYDSYSGVCDSCLKLLNELDQIELRAKEIKLKFQEYVNLTKTDVNTSDVSTKVTDSDNQLSSILFETDGKPEEATVETTLITKEKKGKELFKCPVCKKSYIHKVRAANHIKNQHKDVCSQYEDYYDKPHNHKKDVEIEIPDDTCLENDLESSDTEIKNISKRGRKIKIYENIKLHQCPDCPKKWKSIAELKNHRSSHSEERPYICEICGQAYKHKSALSVHIGMHNGINPFTCIWCKKTFTQKGALNRHMPIHTGEMPFQCDLCGKRFKYHTSFNIHQLTHTGQKSYKCDLCGLGLMSGSHLKRHMRIHTGEKKYSCSICMKRFAEKYNLAAHEKLHVTGSSALQKRKYRCQICPKTYDRRIKLEEHLATEHQQANLTDNRNSTEEFMKYYKNNNSALERYNLDNSADDAENGELKPDLL